MRLTVPVAVPVAGTSINQFVLFVSPACNTRAIRDDKQDLCHAPLSLVFGLRVRIWVKFEGLSFGLGGHIRDHWVKDKRKPLLVVGFWILDYA